MNKPLSTWQLVYDSLRMTIPVMLLYVLESKGSSPGRQGFFMAVNKTGEMSGSIGGGIMEHKLVEVAREKLHDDEEEVSVRKQIHDKSAAKNQSGMICSGEQTILLYTVRQKERDVIQNLVSCLEKGGDGGIQLSPAGLEFISPFNDENDAGFVAVSEGEWTYRQRIGYKQHLYIIGAGHCALALAGFMHGLDFYIHLYDHRPGLNTFLQNQFAHEKVIIDDYSELKNLVVANDRSYVVIMTIGYRTDDLALRALTGKQFKYLGVLGSKNKIKKMFDDYRQEGIQEAYLTRIHAPVGIPINSQTPEEIAISIAAEIIKVKNGEWVNLKVKS